MFFDARVVSHVDLSLTRVLRLQSYVWDRTNPSFVSCSIASRLANPCINDVLHRHAGTETAEFDFAILVGHPSDRTHSRYVRAAARAPCGLITALRNNAKRTVPAIQGHRQRRALRCRRLSKVLWYELDKRTTRT